MFCLKTPTLVAEFGADEWLLCVGNFVVRHSKF
jgi:hypothetical protein